KEITGQKLLQQKNNYLVRMGAVKDQLLHAIGEQAKVGSILWEPGQKMEWNDHLFHFLGYKPGLTQLSHSLILNFMHPEDRKVYKKHLHELQEQKQEVRFPL